MIRTDHREEALLMLHGGGAILETAREVSRLMREARVEGAVIGGVAVVLHGYTRTTCDVDIFAPDPEALSAVLTGGGFAFDATAREYRREAIPVHLVTLEQLRSAPKGTTEIDGITTVSLPDLINMKLRSGTENMLRAIDIADVIGLMRHHRLTGKFASKMDKPLRPTFRKLVKAIAAEG